MNFLIPTINLSCAVPLISVWSLYPHKIGSSPVSNPNSAPAPLLALFSWAIFKSQPNNSSWHLSWNIQNQKNLTDIWGAFHLNTNDYLFSTTALGVLSKISNMLESKVSCSKHSNIEVIPCVLTDHNGIKLEISSKKQHRRHTNSQRLNNTPLNDKWVTDDVKKEIKGS